MAINTAQITKMIKENSVAIGIVVALVVLIVFFYKGNPEQLENTQVQPMQQQFMQQQPMQQQPVMQQQPMQQQPVMQQQPMQQQPVMQQQVVQPDSSPEPTRAFAPAQPKMDEQSYIDNIVAGDKSLKADDLLPRYDAENEFAKENPVSKLLKEQNFLISGYHVGINTVMQSNKIPYHDLRSLPPTPKESVGPWNQSSLEQSPSQLRRGFEIGV
jgi:hypothetical protein